jgi:hypothetical protein
MAPSGRRSISTRGFSPPATICAILEEGICLMVAEPEGKVPDLRVSPLEVEPAGSLASAILIAA